MRENIEIYKESFVDIKVIYNMPEKEKRYRACEATYEALTGERAAIEETVGALNECKKTLASNYRHLEEELALALRTLGNKIIFFIDAFVHDYTDLFREVSLSCCESKEALSAVPLTSFEAELAVEITEDYFEEPVPSPKCELMPAFVVHHRKIRPNKYPEFGKLVASYIR